jgi:uncharacterized protein
MNIYTRERPKPEASSATGEALWVAYRWMALALLVTGVVAVGIASSPAAMAVLMSNRLVFFGLMAAQLGLVITFGRVAQTSSTTVVATMFFSYAVLTGITFSTLFMAYTSSSIGSTFLITAGAFAGLSLVGLFTKRDLSAVGRFAIFSLIGLLIASVVGIFVQSSALQWGISAAGILVFGALTAYDTQRLKTMLADSEASGNMPLVAALTLYLDFINLFLFLLRFLGGRRSDG